MPATREAAATTDAYRARLARLRDATARSIVARFQAIDLDRPRQFDAWASDGAILIEAAQETAATTSSVYLGSYLEQSGLASTVKTIDPTAYSGTLDRTPIHEALQRAPAAVYWQLGKKAGRLAAIGLGIDVTVRLTRSAVSNAARQALSDQMVAEPSVVGWRRVTSARPCGACLALAGKRMTDDHVFETHHRCGCSAEPIVAGMHERFNRPNGQQMFDDMTDSQRAELFAGTGGADKAAIVAARGLDSLISRKNGQIIETPLSAL